jgi:hypothetical protein
MSLNNNTITLIVKLELTQLTRAIPVQVLEKNKKKIDQCNLIKICDSINLW